MGRGRGQNPTTIGWAGINMSTSRLVSSFAAKVLAGAIIGAFLIPTNTSALSINISKPSFSMFDKSTEVEVAKTLVQRKSDKFEQEIKQVEAISNEKSILADDIVSISKEIQEVKRQIEAKREFENSKVVKIGRYAPNSAGNAYAWGNCTSYVKTKRPDIGSFWGNANQWIDSARRDGFSTGDRPKIGAIGVSFNGFYGHVVYVESLNDDGTIVVSEMNYAGLNVVSSRATSPSEFSYIYALD